MLRMIRLLRADPVDDVRAFAQIPPQGPGPGHNDGRTGASVDLRSFGWSWTLRGLPTQSWRCATASRRRIPPSCMWCQASTVHGREVGRTKRNASLCHHMFRGAITLPSRWLYAWCPRILAYFVHLVTPFSATFAPRKRMFARHMACLLISWAVFWDRSRQYIGIYSVVPSWPRLGP